MLFFTDGLGGVALPAAALTPPPLIRADHINVDVISKILQNVLSNFLSRDHHHVE